MKGALLSEWRLLIARRVLLFFSAAWAAMLAGFSLGIPFAVYLSLKSDPTQDTDTLRSMILLENAPTTTLGSYPMFGAAMMLLLGILIAGPEFRWGTWTARLSQGPNRTQVITAKAVVAVITAGIVIAVALLVALIVSGALTLSLGVPLTAPNLGHLSLSFAASWGIAAAWVIVGFGLSIIFRGTMAPAVLGLLWILAIENIIAGLAGVLKWLEPVRALTLGAASGSLASWAGAPSTASGGTPGVTDILSPGAAILVALVHCAVFYTAALLLTKRRDVTGNS